MKLLAVLTCLLCMFAFSHIALAQDNTSSSSSSSSGTDTTGASSPDNGKSQVSANDAQISSLMMRRMHDEGINSDGLKIKSQAGKVTLSGHLKNKADQGKIVAIARSIPGVQSVETQFTDEDKK